MINPTTATTATTMAVGTNHQNLKKDGEQEAVLPSVEKENGRNPRLRRFEEYQNTRQNDVGFEKSVDQQKYQQQQQQQQKRQKTTPSTFNNQFTSNQHQQQHVLSPSAPYHWAFSTPTARQDMECKDDDFLHGISKSYEDAAAAAAAAASNKSRTFHNHAEVHETEDLMPFFINNNNNNNNNNNRSPTQQQEQKESPFIQSSSWPNSVSSSSSSSPRRCFVSEIAKDEISPVGNDNQNHRQQRHGRHHQQQQQQQQQHLTDSSCFGGEEYVEETDEHLLQIHRAIKNHEEIVKQNALARQKNDTNTNNILKNALELLQETECVRHIHLLEYISLLNTACEFYFEEKIAQCFLDRVEQSLVLLNHMWSYTSVFGLSSSYTSLSSSSSSGLYERMNKDDILKETNSAICKIIIKLVKTGRIVFLDRMCKFCVRRRWCVCSGRNIGFLKLLLNKMPVDQRMDMVRVMLFSKYIHMEYSHCTELFQFLILKNMDDVMHVCLNLAVEHCETTKTLKHKKNLYAFLCHAAMHMCSSSSSSVVATNNQTSRNNKSVSLKMLKLLLMTARTLSMSHNPNVAAEDPISGRMGASRSDAEHLIQTSCSSDDDYSSFLGNKNQNKLPPTLYQILKIVVQQGRVDVCEMLLEDIAFGAINVTCKEPEESVCLGMMNQNDKKTSSSSSSSSLTSIRSTTMMDTTDLIHETLLGMAIFQGNVEMVCTLIDHCNDIRYPPTMKKPELNEKNQCIDLTKFFPILFWEMEHVDVTIRKAILKKLIHAQQPIVDHLPWWHEIVNTLGWCESE
jgi:hypothetical protein